MRTSREFYTELKVEGLAQRKKPIHTKRELSYLKKILNKKQRILDIGCGYGRFTIPLAKQGYKIEGIDITPLLIRAAKKTAKKEKLSINFKIGDMRKLPYKNKSFDIILCMWSVFVELSRKPNQLKALKEMLRVLSKKGFALIDLPLPLRKSKIIFNKENDRFVRKGNLIVGKIAGIEAVTSYRHNKKTLTSLIKKLKVKKYKIFIDKFGGRNRLFLKFWKT